MNPEAENFVENFQTFIENLLLLPYKQPLNSLIDLAGYKVRAPVEPDGLIEFMSKNHPKLNAAYNVNKDELITSKGTAARLGSKRKLSKRLDDAREQGLTVTISEHTFKFIQAEDSSSEDDSSSDSKSDIMTRVRNNSWGSRADIHKGDNSKIIKSEPASGNSLKEKVDCLEKLMVGYDFRKIELTQAELRTKQRLTPLKGRSDNILDNAKCRSLNSPKPKSVFNQERLSNNNLQPKKVSQFNVDAQDDNNQQMLANNLEIKNESSKRSNLSDGTNGTEDLITGKLKEFSQISLYRNFNGSFNHGGSRLSNAQLLEMVADKLKRSGLKDLINPSINGILPNSQVIHSDEEVVKGRNNLDTPHGRVSVALNNIGSLTSQVKKDEGRNLFLSEQQRDVNKKLSIEETQAKGKDGIINSLKANKDHSDEATLNVFRLEESQVVYNDGHPENKLTDEDHLNPMIGPKRFGPIQEENETVDYEHTKSDVIISEKSDAKSNEMTLSSLSNLVEPSLTNKFFKIETQSNKLTVKEITNYKMQRESLQKIALKSPRISRAQDTENYNDNPITTKNSHTKEVERHSKFKFQLELNPILDRANEQTNRMTSNNGNNLSPQSFRNGGNYLNDKKEQRSVKSVTEFKLSKSRGKVTSCIYVCEKTRQVNEDVTMNSLKYLDNRSREPSLVQEFDKSRISTTNKNSQARLPSPLELNDKSLANELPVCFIDKKGTLIFENLTNHVNDQNAFTLKDENYKSESRMTDINEMNRLAEGIAINLIPYSGGSRDRSDIESFNEGEKPADMKKDVSLYKLVLSNKNDNLDKTPTSNIKDFVVEGLQAEHRDQSVPEPKDVDKQQTIHAKENKTSTFSNAYLKFDIADDIAKTNTNNKKDVKPSKQHLGQNIEPVGAKKENTQSGDKNTTVRDEESDKKLALVENNSKPISDDQVDIQKDSKTKDVRPIKTSPVDQQQSEDSTTSNIKNQIQNVAQIEDNKDCRPELVQKNNTKLDENKNDTVAKIDQKDSNSTPVEPNNQKNNVLLNKQKPSDHVVDVKDKNPSIEHTKIDSAKEESKISKNLTDVDNKPAPLVPKNKKMGEKIDKIQNSEETNQIKKEVNESKVKTQAQSDGKVLAKPENKVQLGVENKIVTVAVVDENRNQPFNETEKLTSVGQTNARVNRKADNQYEKIAEQKHAPPDSTNESKTEHKDLIKSINPNKIEIEVAIDSNIEDPLKYAEHNISTQKEHENKPDKLITDAETGISTNEHADTNITARTNKIGNEAIVEKHHSIGTSDIVKKDEPRMRTESKPAFTEEKEVFSNLKPIEIIKNDSNLKEVGKTEQKINLKSEQQNTLTGSQLKGRKVEFALLNQKDEPQTTVVVIQDDSEVLKPPVKNTEQKQDEVNESEMYKTLADNPLIPKDRESKIQQTPSSEDDDIIEELPSHIKRMNTSNQELLSKIVLDEELKAIQKSENTMTKKKSEELADSIKRENDVQINEATTIKNQVKVTKTSLAKFKRFKVRSSFDHGRQGMFMKTPPGAENFQYQGAVVEDYESPNGEVIDQKDNITERNYDAEDGYAKEGSHKKQVIKRVKGEKNVNIIKVNSKVARIKELRGLAELNTNADRNNYFRKTRPKFDIAEIKPSVGLSQQLFRHTHTSKVAMPNVINNNNRLLPQIIDNKNQLIKASKSSVNFNRCRVIFKDPNSSVIKQEQTPDTCLMPHNHLRDKQRLKSSIKEHKEDVLYIRSVSMKHISPYDIENTNAFLRKAYQVELVATDTSLPKTGFVFAMKFRVRKLPRIM